MNQFSSAKIKTIAGLVGMALLLLANSALATLTISTANQNNAAAFTPTWAVAPNSLLAGLSPSASFGNFTQESAGGLSKLTDGAIGPILASGNQTALATCGNNGGQMVIYDLPANANGYNITNISTYSGWGNGGRHAQAYTLYYATKASPRNFILLGNVVYSGGFTGNNPNNPSANQVIWADSTGAAIAANTAAIMIDFSTPTDPNGENGYSGYSEITVQGPAAVNVVTQTVAIAASNQNGANPFTPNWTLETPNLISGLAPTTANGNFYQESPTSLGSRNVNSLTAGGSLTISSATITANNANTTSPNYLTGGGGGGTTLIYTLTNNTVNGSDVTNIIVYNGWADNGRFGQYYYVSYSTVAAPTTYIPITLVYYIPSVPGNTPVANRVAITSTNGVPLGSAVATIKFDFSSPPDAAAFNNGYQGYAQIIVQGHDTTAPPPPPSPVLTQDTLPSYAATVVGDQITFTASYSNTPPVTPQWLFVGNGVTNTINTGVVNATNNGVVTSTVTINNLTTNSSGYYTLEGLNATNGAAAPSFSSRAQLVVNSTPSPVGSIVMNYAEQAGLGAISPVNVSTNFYPFWTIDTANDLIQGSLTNSSPGVPGTFIAGLGNFNFNGGAGAVENPDPTILSDGSFGYQVYWPNVGGNLTLCSCGVGGAGDTMTYTLPATATYGFDVTNITVYGGWADHGRNEQKYQILYSTVANPTTFINLGTFDYNPNDPANQPSATRTMLLPVSGALAKNVYAVEINWNVASAPKNNWEGYSEVVVQGIPSLANPVLVQDTLPAYAETMVGDQVVFTAAFSNAPAANVQWQFITTNNVVSNIAGANTTTLTLNNVQLTNSGSYRLEAVSQANGAAIAFSSAAQLVVNPVPTPVNNIVFTAAGQTGYGPGSTGTSTNFTPTWTADTANDLILGFQDGGLNSPGSVYAGIGNFGLAGSYGDPAILSDGDTGFLTYNPGTGGNSTLVTCGPYSTVSGANYAGVSLTYTLNTGSAVNGFDLTNIVVYGGWGDSGQNEQKYQVLYSTVGAPNTFIPMTGWVDYLPTDPNGWQSATRTTLTPAAGVMAKNVYAVQISFNNQAVIPKNFYSGYSEIIVGGQVAPARPLLTQDVTPTTAEDVQGSSLTLTASFVNATSYQWLKNGTNLSGATSSTLTLNNLQVTDTATNGGYSLVALSANGTNVSSACTVLIDPAPVAVSNVITGFAYQTSAGVGFAPTWDTSALSSSLIYGVSASGQSGDFTGAGDQAAGVPVLNDGNYGVFASDGTHAAFAAAGPGAGKYISYLLGNNPNGYTVTNIQIAGGWNDNGRDSQYYTVLYSTVANPTLFSPLVAVTNNLSTPPYGVGDETVVRATMTAASGVLASNVAAIYVDFQYPQGVPNGYSGYSEISVFGSPSVTPPPAGPVITAAHVDGSTNIIWTVETPNLIAGQLPSSYGSGVFTEEGCNVTNLTDGNIGYGAAFGASCGDDGAAVPWIIFSPTNGGSWNLTNIVVYTLWTDYGRDGQYYNLSYSTTSAPAVFLPLVSVAYNPYVAPGVSDSGNRVQITPPAGQTMLASNVAAVKFDFSSQGTEDYGWTGYSEIVLQGANLAPVLPPAAPVIAAPYISGGNLILTGMGGTPNSPYTWLSTTNLAAPIIWTTNSTGTLNGAGGFSNAIPVSGSTPAKFFRLRQP
jgi:hypothetical protein